MEKNRYSIFLFCFGLILMSCSGSPPEFRSIDMFIMDTYVNIKLPVSESEPDLKEEIKFRIESEQNLVDKYIPDSDISKLNSEGFIETGENSLVDIIKKSEFLNNLTDGLFSITLAPVLKFWSEPGKEYKNFPYSPESFKYLSRPQTETVRPEKLSREKFRIELSSGVELDPGAIAKGYIVDKLADYLMAEKNISYGLINAGGDIYAWGGEHKKSGTWSVGIQDPREQLGVYDYIVQLKSGSVTTSGDYERYIIVNGKRFHHIIDPRTMISSDNAHSVTVITETPVLLKDSQSRYPAAEADALSTAIMCMEKKAARLFCEKHHIMAIIYEKDYNCYISPSLKNSTTVKIKRSEHGK